MAISYTNYVNIIGFRVVVKEDINACPSQLVYGVGLRLPGEFISEVNRDVSNPQAEFVAKLKRFMNDLRPTQTAHHSSGKVFIEKDLYSSDQVFVRNSMICKPLQAPYEGPFTVLKRFDKYFVVDVKGRKVNISVDRLKAAFSEQYFKEQEVKPLVTDKNDHKTYTSRYGRKAENIKGEALSLRVDNAARLKFEDKVTLGEVLENSSSENNGVRNSSGSKNSNPENSGPKNNGLQNSVPENSNLENSSSKNSDPKNSTTENSGPKNNGLPDSGLENSNLKNSSSENCDPKNSTTENSGLEHNGSQNSSSENSGSENSSLENTGSENSGLENSGSENTASENNGFRVVVKEDINACPSQLVYGVGLRLPGEFISEVNRDVSNPQAEFVAKLKRFMNDLRPTQTAHHSSGKVFIEKDLYSSDQVFVRNSMICKPLQAPYEGPFTVLKRFDKYFVVDVKGRKVNISVDRLKAAFSEQYFKEQEVKPLVTDKNDHKTYTSRYGRKAENIKGEALSLRVDNAARLKFEDKVTLGEVLENSSSENNGVRNSSGSKNSNSENSGRKNNGLQNSVPENSNLENSSSKNSDPKNSTTENSGPKNNGLPDSGLENSNSENSNLKNSSLEKCDPKNSTTENSGLDNSGLDHNGSQNISSENSGSENSSLEKAGSENSGLKNSASENTASENNG
ncbi:uncharacterized protein DDB_G0288805-like [Teleopsis dalmanni]|uniref:uncharacterized protein DDB_G0288805-like n=1 Tax=Teleopsis dalmanni TaxID=139649 RepID=UPI0018CF99F1|nr:uncharacterized protein DDB_G0288805-like [Teleopsis dalmanni]